MIWRLRRWFGLIPCFSKPCPNPARYRFLIRDRGRKFLRYTCALHHGQAMGEAARWQAR